MITKDFYNIIDSELSELIEKFTDNEENIKQFIFNMKRILDFKTKDMEDRMLLMEKLQKIEEKNALTL